MTRLQKLGAEVVHVNPEHSRCCCWARHVAQSLYAGEDWYCQVDAHTLFREGWDQSLIDMTEQVGGNPVLTTYLPHFGHEADGPTLITFQDFEPHGWSVSSEGRPPGGLGHKPVRARFVAAGLLFVPGRFVQDVPYDSLLLYAAEEPALAVHAFTHGYDLHHPYQHVCVHRYEREDPRYRHYHQDRCPETILRQEAVERQRIQSLLGAGP